jgi:hypothetical protein
MSSASKWNPDLDAARSGLGVEVFTIQLEMGCVRHFMAGGDSHEYQVVAQVRRIAEMCSACVNTTDAAAAIARMR